MITYSPGTWHVAFICTLKGSVFPKGVAWALPSALIALLVHRLSRTDVNHAKVSISSAVGLIWAGYSFVLGFLIVFRTQQAYNRFWEGATLLQQVRGTWFNAVSSLFAFCSEKEDKQTDVATFQQLTVKLMSLLFCSALQVVAEMKDESFEVIDLDGFDSMSLDYLDEVPEHKLDIILQWMQRSIVQNMQNGVVPIAPPILSRVFQELSNGVVAVTNAQKLTDIPFPFPYAQMVSSMLLMSWIGTPMVAGTYVKSAPWAAALTFVLVFAFWSINYIAAEIEMPFGDDWNDLNVTSMQESMNASLLVLLDMRCQVPPSYTKGTVKTKVMNRSLRLHEAHSILDMDSIDMDVSRQTSTGGKSLSDVASRSLRLHSAHAPSPHVEEEAADMSSINLRSEPEAKTETKWNATKVSPYSNPLGQNMSSMEASLLGKGSRLDVPPASAQRRSPGNEASTQPTKLTKQKSSQDTLIAKDASSSSSAPAYTCPAGHILQKLGAPVGVQTCCSQCRDLINVGEPTWACRQCHHDICRRCYPGLTQDHDTTAVMESHLAQIVREMGLLCSIGARFAERAGLCQDWQNAKLEDYSLARFDSTRLRMDDLGAWHIPHESLDPEPALCQGVQL